MNKHLSLEQKKIEYFNRINKIFPELSLATASTTHKINELPTGASIELSNQSKAFKKKFNYNGEIIHYTNLDSLLNILNSQKVRMYNCQNLNDEDEIRFASRKLNLRINDDEVKLHKNNYFLFSASKYNLDLNNEDFNLWRLYANSGLGAAIVFEIQNYESDWKNIFYGQVNYGVDDKMQNEMLSFIQIHNEFNDEFHLFENTPSIIPAIALHFKNFIWSIENEVRLIAYCPFDKNSLQPEPFSLGNAYLSSTMHHTLNKFGKLSAYVELPLNIMSLKSKFLEKLSLTSADSYLSSFPHLKIKRIILGHMISKDIFNSIHQLLCQSIAEKLGYSIELGYSNFHESYRT